MNKSFDAIGAIYLFSVIPHPLLFWALSCTANKNLCFVVPFPHYSRERFYGPIVSRNYRLETTHDSTWLLSNSRRIVNDMLWLSGTIIDFSLTSSWPNVSKQSPACFEKGGFALSNLAFIIVETTWSEQLWISNYLFMFCYCIRGNKKLLSLKILEMIFTVWRLEWIFRKRFCSWVDL